MNNNKNFWFLHPGVSPKPYEFVHHNVKSNIILLLDEQVMQSLWGYIDCFVQGTNSDEFFTISDEVSKDLFSSITELKVCTDQDLISSTFNDLDSTSVNEEILDFLGQTNKTYYINTLFNWLDNKFSFLKQDFGKLFPNSVYAMQDLNATLPHNTDLTVMLIDRIENNVQNIGAVTDGLDLGNFNTLYSDIVTNPDLSSLSTRTNISYSEHRRWFVWIFNLFNTMWPNLDISLNRFIETGVTQVLTNLNMEQFVNTLNEYIDNYEQSANRFFTVIDDWERYPNYGEYIEHMYMQPRHILMDTSVYNEITSYVNTDTGIVDAGLVDAMARLVDIGVIVLR